MKSGKKVSLFLFSTVMTMFAVFSKSR